MTTTEYTETPSTYKVKANTVNGPRTFWAALISKKGSKTVLLKLNEDGCPGESTRIVIGSGTDIVWMKPAHMSKKYGLLEVIK